MTHRDLAYVRDAHPRQKLDLYLPRAGTDHPLIIYIHGGAFRMGSKEQGVPLDYVERGYAVASINYRLSQHALFPAQLEDCKAAVRWLRAHAAQYRLDPTRVAAWGPSAGGHLAAMLGTTGDTTEFDVGDHLDQSSRVQAVVDYFGPTDFLQMDAHRPPGGMVHDSADSPESQLIGGAIRANPEKAQRANPISYITGGAPPFLICHGDLDPLVPHHQSELLATALKHAGGTVTLYTVAGAGHGGFADPQVDTRTREFLATHLRRPASTGRSQPTPGTDRPESWAFHGGEWRMEDGVLSVSGAQEAKALVAGVTLADMELEVDIRIDEPGTQAGILYRVADPAEGLDAFAGYYVGLHAAENQLLWGAVDHGWQELARKPMPVEPGQWYPCRIRVQGDNLKMFVGDREVPSSGYPGVDGVDARFTEGQLGLRTLGGAAQFRNVRIRPVTSEPGGPRYTNPVQSGCADPVVLKHDGMYYAYCTYSPDYPRMVKGIRMYASPDLVHWDDHGYVLQNEDSWGDSRFWAPDIVEEDGIFYLYYAADTRICVATADSPMGPFRQVIREPMQPDSIRIDAHVFLDDDGRRYFYYVHFDQGNEIWGGLLNPDLVSVDAGTLRRMIRPDQPWERQRGAIVEGPEVIKHKGTYYLTYSGSHFESPDYAVGYAVADSPLGPWRKYAFNPIMKSTAYAHGTAHHCLIPSPDDNEMFIVYHRHHTLTETEPRQLSIDRIRFVPQADGPDVLEVWGPTSSPQPMPSGAPGSEGTEPAA